MADSMPPGDSSWRSILAYFIITAIALSAEYIRRIMPPPRKRRKWDAEDEDRQFQTDEAKYAHDKDEREEDEDE